MWVRLLRSWTNEQGKKLPIARAINFTRDKARRLISEGIAEEYTEGKFPPDKIKTEFFKPKKNKRHGNNRSSNR